VSYGHEDGCGHPGSPCSCDGKNTEPMSRDDKMKIIINRMNNKINAGDFDFLHQQHLPVRSRQIGALIEVLLDCGAINEKNLFSD